MSKIYAYLGINIPKQDLKDQQIIIETYCQNNNFQIEQIIIENHHKKELNFLLKQLKEKDTIIFYDMDQIDCTFKELSFILQNFIKNNIYFIFLKENINTQNYNQKILIDLINPILKGITQFEQNLIRKRIQKNLILAKKNGKIIGRPLGSKNKHMKLDKNLDQIKKYLELGLNKTSISILLGVTTKTLRKYYKLKNLNP